MSMNLRFITVKAETLFTLIFQKEDVFQILEHPECRETGFESDTFEIIKLIEHDSQLRLILHLANADTPLQHLMNGGVLFTENAINKISNIEKSTVNNFFELNKALQYADIYNNCIALFQFAKKENLLVIGFFS